MSQCLAYKHEDFNSTVLSEDGGPVRDAGTHSRTGSLLLQPFVYDLLSSAEQTEDENHSSTFL